LAVNGDADNLAVCMNHLIADSSLRRSMGAEARLQAARYKEETVLEQYAQFYASLA